MKADIIRSIRRAIKNETSGADEIHNEMLEIEPYLAAELLLELWRLIGRTTYYPKEWSRCLLTPIYKKGEVNIPENDRPVCMLSCMRNVVEAALAEKVAKQLDVKSRHYGFSKGISPTGHCWTQTPF